MAIRTQPLNTFLDDLASSAPAPGGGAAAALSAALGASLVSMVCNLTIGREKYKSAEPVMLQTLTKADELRGRALQLVDEDAAVYGQVRHSYSLPKLTESDIAARAMAIQAALRVATDVPLQIMSVGAEVIQLCADIVADANTTAISDLEVGVLQALAAMEGAASNVKINVQLLIDSDYVAHAKDQMSMLLKNGREITADIRRLVDESIAS